MLKLWSLISAKSALPNKTESDLFESQRESHFTGAPENTFLRKVETNPKLP